MYGLLGTLFMDLNQYWAWGGEGGWLGEAGRPSMHLHTIHTPGHGVKDYCGSPFRIFYAREFQSMAKFSGDELRVVF